MFNIGYLRSLSCVDVVVLSAGRFRSVLYMTFTALVFGFFFFFKKKTAYEMRIIDWSSDVCSSDLLETSVPGIYAAGDVTGRDQFVYMAAYGAKLAARNAVTGNQYRYDNSSMPSVVFTDPQVASAGLTETTARAQGLDIKVSLLPLDAVPRALAARDTRGLIKLIADKANDRLLGGQIMAPEGADSIQTLVLAIKHGMTTLELDATIFPYLTTVEGLKLAAQTFDKDVAKLSCCAG